ncbi:hypothetical protein B7494_g2897 [Chlorociboria aeruginascens]|nr:hypothetical protein B7494_g2897 [Chlorociboria aeruginascens]
MSYVTRRALSTLIPPKIASPSGIGAAQDAARMSRVVSFYEKLPRGPAPETKATGLLGRYHAKYFGKNQSATPLIHAIIFLIGIGYAQNYYFHLRNRQTIDDWMMATEAISDTLATPSTLPDHDPNSTETQAQDVSSDVPVINGDNTDKDGNRQDTEPIDASINSAEVSVSGGSDTEASKTETSKSQYDGKGHLRTASTVKKLASFKPVSVNKTFLAAKTTVTPSKLGDKAAAPSPTAQTPTASLASRPRLVAKSGSGLRDSTPRASSAASGTKPGGAPDASVVWNKNRPAPPPEPKRFTDEELKQQYGIHLATRLQSDDPGKQANWADIDDDDEDWAPEIIEWTDGTKITLAQADEPAPPTPEPVPAVIRKEPSPVEAIKPSKSPVPQATPTVRPSGFGSGRAGLVLKGASEKPTLVAKPPGPPTPVKSPWAPLPPVDKVPPINIEIHQNQPPQSRFGQRDPHGFHAMPPPAKEIAADDFSRSWRDGNSSASRELYNSQSGRYEPVNDNRRGSRNEAHSRGPAVLQRPQQDGPAEPSAAFQTHRTGGQDAGYGRRRNSSNVSGGSGNYGRRMSRGHDMPPHDLLSARRGSLAAVSDTPSSPRNFSPSGQHSNYRGHQNPQWQSRASPVVSHPSPHSVHGQMAPPGAMPESYVQNQPQSAIPFEDPIETQKKIMRQTRELAIKRRQEEEAKEEAARKERIRLKLEAMGPAPESKSSKKDAPKEEKSIPTQIQARESDSIAAQSKTVESEASAKANVDIESAKKIPAGMNAPDSKLDDKSPNQDNHINGIHNDVSHPNNNIQSWSNNSFPQPERSTWAPAPPQQTSSRSVWGPPTNDRTLGNGTFNPELSRLPDMHQSSNPGPIGPPHGNRGNNTYQSNRGRESYGPRPTPIGPPNRQQLPMSQHEQQGRAAWASLPEKLAKEEVLAHQQRDIEMARRRELPESGLASEGSQPVFQDKWKQVTLNEDGTRSKPKSVVTTTHEVSGNPRAWKPQEEASTRSIFEEQENGLRRQLDAANRSNVPSSYDPWKSTTNMSSSPPVRDSRFFPRDVRLEDPNTNFDRPGSPSPPPPTMAGHPAYDGDSEHPHVSLPRPSPVVKLPPPVLAPIGPPPKPITSFAAAAASAAPVNNAPLYPGRQDYHSRGQQYQDARWPQEAQTSEIWQERINSLIGRKSPPGKHHTLAVDSSSKNTLELPRSHLAATVSLPGSPSGEFIIDDDLIISKPAAEECFEEQEMGSLPLIRFPHKAPADAWQLAPHPHQIPRKFLVQHATSAEAIKFTQQTIVPNLHIKEVTQSLGVHAPELHDMDLVRMAEVVSHETLPAVFHLQILVMDLILPPITHRAVVATEQDEEVMDLIGIVKPLHQFALDFGQNLRHFIGRNHRNSR